LRATSDVIRAALAVSPWVSNEPYWLSRDGGAVSIKTELVGHAAVVIIDEPAVRNSLDLSAVDRLTEELERASNLPNITGIVVTGNGAFCAGANLRSVAERTKGSSKTERQGSVEKHAQGLVRTIVGLPVPTIAAIDGPAVGMGFDIALACDSRLIGPDGWCMQGWGRVGLIGGTGGDLFLRLLNPAIIWKLLEDQPRIDGPLAERWGLGEAIARGTAREAAFRRVEMYSSMPRQALSDYVMLHRASVQDALDAHLTICGAMQVDLLGDPQFSERVAKLIGSKQGK
jgi:2-(1,2-epoxy-1,2-dihydrophenyl)acetyl-CoA isomerase